MLHLRETNNNKKRALIRSYFIYLFFFGSKLQTTLDNQTAGPIVDDWVESGVVQGTGLKNLKLWGGNIKPFIHSEDNKSGPFSHVAVVAPNPQRPNYHPTIKIQNLHLSIIIQNQFKQNKLTKYGFLQS